MKIVIYAYLWIVTISNKDEDSCSQWPEMGLNKTFMLIQQNPWEATPWEVNLTGKQFWISKKKFEISDFTQFLSDFT